MDVFTLYHRSVETWADRVNAVRPEQWDLPTPCRDWSVRDLANHVTGEDRWTVPLMRGSTPDEVGHQLDGDLLGDDPIRSSLAAAARGDHGGPRDAALGRAGAPVVRRRGACGVPAPAGRRPPGPRLGPGGRDRERPAAGPGAGPRGRGLVRRAGGACYRSAGRGGGASGRRGRRRRAGRAARGVRARPGVGAEPRRCGPVVRGLRARRRRRDHGDAHRRLRLRVDVPARRRGREGGGRHPRGVDRAVLRRRVPASRRRSCSSPATAGCWGGATPGPTTTGGPDTCGASTSCGSGTVGCARSGPTSRGEDRGRFVAYSHRTTPLRTIDVSRQHE